MPNPIKQETGRLGGLKTYQNHGRNHYVQMGQAGGRPRLPTLEEARQRQAQTKIIIESEEQLPESLTKLKRLYKQRKQDERLLVIR